MGEEVKIEEIKVDRRRRLRHKVAAWCCLLWIIIIMIIVLLVLYFGVYRSKDPSFQVQSITLRSLNIGEADNANATLDLWIIVHNPNKASFHFTDSKAFMYYYGAEIGFACLPDCSLGSKSSTYLNVPLTVTAFNSFGGPFLKGDIAGGMIPVTVAIQLGGHVTLLRITHRESTTAHCYAVLSPKVKVVVDYVCKYD